MFFVVGVLTLALQLFPTGSVAQKDSLFRVWGQTGLPDTTRLKAINELVSQFYMRSDPDSARLLSEMQLQLARKTGDRHFEAEAFTNIAFAADFEGNYQASYENHQLAAAIREQTGDKKNLARNYNNMGAACRFMGQYARSLECQQKALDLHTEIGNIAGRAASYNGMGTVYLTQGYRSKNKQARQEANTKALEYYTQALALSREADDLRGISIALNNSALVLFEMGNMTQSKARHEEVLALANETNNTYLKSSALNNIGVVLETMADSAATSLSRDSLRQAALNHYLEGLAMREVLGQTDLITNSLTNIAVLKRRMANDAKAPLRKKLLAEAAAAAERSLALNAQTQNLSEKNHVAEALANIYQDQGKFKEALEAYKMYVTTRDSINSEDQRAELTRQELTYEFERKEFETARKHESELLLEKNRQLRTQLLGVLLGVIVVFLLLVLWQRRKSAMRLAEKNKQVEAARAAAERSEAAKQQFLANMSHEIRTPMNAISGLSRLLLDQSHDPRTEQYLRAINHSSQNLMVVLNDILDQAKIEAGKLDIRIETIDLMAELHNAIRIWGGKAQEKGLKINLHTAPGLPRYVKADGSRLSQIMGNLLGNAIKFTDRGSVKLTARASDDKLFIEVEDTGSGIPADKLSQVFESFKQISDGHNRRTEGTGLGLSIARQLAILMGGMLEAESTQGQGSTFRLWIPLVPADALSLAAPKNIERNNVEAWVIVAEDNEYNFIVTLETLRKYFPNVRVVRANDGEEVLELLDEDGYDLVLMDVQMPRMDGYEATRKIRESGNQIPIIGLTASVLRSDLDLCIRAGMNGYVPKPFQESEFIEAVSSALPKIEAVRPPVEDPATNLQKEQERFLRHMPEKIEMLASAIRANDPAGIAAAAHLIRPQTTACQLNDLTEICVWLETSPPENVDIIPMAQRLMASLGEMMELWSK